MVDRSAVANSLRAVREAHRVLDAFHRELVALFDIIEDQLGDKAHGCALTDFERGFVSYSTGSPRKVADWVASTRGLLYYDEDLEVGEDAPETLDSRSVAMIRVTAGAADEVPECRFGLARPGEGTKFTDAWNFGRNGLWNYDLADPEMNTWARGSLDGYASAGAGGLWAISRAPLIDLVDAEAIKTLVTTPLLREWTTVIRGSTKTS